MLNFKNTPSQINRDRRYSISDGIFWVLMNSISLSFLVPFIISLGASPLQVGLIDTLPIFLTSFLVLISYKILSKFDSKRQAVIFFVTLQAFLWIPLALVKFFFTGSSVIWIIILIYVLLVGCGVIIDPIYRDWIRKLFPPEIISRFIANKNIILDTFSILPIIFAGLFLDVVTFDKNLFGFVGLFIFAGVFRFISSRMLHKMSKTEDKQEVILETKQMSKPIFSIFRKEVLKDKVFLNFLILVLFYYFGLYISTSYFSYLLLSVLKFKFSHYILWSVAFVFGSVFSLSYWGYISQMYGSVRILKATIAFIPFTLIIEYFFINNLPVLIVLQFISGIIFAGFNYSIINYFYQNVKDDLINHMGFFYIFQASAMLCGSLVGAGLIKIGERMYGNEVQAIFLVIVVSMVFRYIAFMYSRKLKSTKINSNTKEIDLYRNIILQVPVSYSVKQFWHVLSRQERAFVTKFKSKMHTLNKK